MKAKYGVHVGVSRAEDAKSASKLAQELEDIGVDGVFLADSLALPHDPLLMLMAFANSTSRISLGTSVYLLPLRNPLLVAKYLASLQTLSNGRLIFGLGVGWRRQDFQALNVPFDKRGLVTDESLQILKTAWAKNRLSFQGEYFKIENIETNAKMDKSPPIWVGGNSKAAIHRAAKYGDGWIPTDFTLDEYEDKLPLLQEELKKERDFDPRRSDFVVASHLMLLLDRSKSKAEEAARQVARRFGETLDEFKSGSIVGGVSEVAERLSAYNGGGVNYHVLSAYVIRDRERMLNMLRLFEKEVVPSL